MISILRRLFSNKKKMEERMETREYISPLRAAEMEVEVNNQRVDLALRALQRFCQQNKVIVDGKRHWITSDIRLVLSLQAEEHGLLVEYDEARRCQSKAIADYNFLLPPRSCIGEGARRQG